MKWISDKSFATRQVWCDASSSISGIGTEDQPLTYEQLRNYFNPNLGVYSDIIATAGDLINIKGVVQMGNYVSVFDVGHVVNGSIWMCSWSVVDYGPWKIIANNSIASDITLFTNQSMCWIGNLQIRDFIFSQNSGLGAILKPISFDPGSAPKNIELKNFEIISEGTISMGVAPDCSLGCYGYSLAADQVYLGEAGDGVLIMRAGTIKANKLYDTILA